MVYIMGILCFLVLRSSSFIKSKEATWTWMNIGKTKERSGQKESGKKKRDWVNIRNNRKCTNVVIHPYLTMDVFLLKHLKIGILANT